MGKSVAAGEEEKDKSEEKKYAVGMCRLADQNKQKKSLYRYPAGLWSERVGEVTFGTCSHTDKHRHTRVRHTQHKDIINSLTRSIYSVCSSPLQPVMSRCVKVTPTSMEKLR